MEIFDIIFQVIPDECQDWHESKIVYILEDVPVNYDVTIICDVISVLNVFQTIRYARLSKSEAHTIEQANRHSGGYYQARPRAY